jgi:hypothetical protein
MFGIVSAEIAARQFARHSERMMVDMEKAGKDMQKQAEEIEKMAKEAERAMKRQMEEAQ